MPKEIAEFLCSNGFKRTFGSFTKGQCIIEAKEDRIEIEFYDETYKDTFNFYVKGHNIYELIGFLTYNDLMDKNYKQ